MSFDGKLNTICPICGKKLKTSYEIQEGYFGEKEYVIYGFHCYECKYQKWKS